MIDKNTILKNLIDVDIKLSKEDKLEINKEEFKRVKKNIEDEKGDSEILAYPELESDRIVVNKLRRIVAKINISKDISEEDELSTLDMKNLLILAHFGILHRKYEANKPIITFEKGKGRFLTLKTGKRVNITPNRMKKRIKRDKK